MTNCDCPTHDKLKKLMKEAMREVVKELEEEDKNKPVYAFDIPCYSCKQPVKNGEHFVIYHGSCIDKIKKGLFGWDEKK